MEGSIASLPPSVAVSPSGCPYENQLYVVWKKDAPGSGSSVMFARSSDGGATWEPPTVLSEPVDRGNDIQDGKAAHSAYLPAIAVNKDGDVFWDLEYMKDNKALFDKLKTIATIEPQPEVHIRADQDARYESVGRLIVAAQRAGIAKVGFITEPPPKN